MDGSSIDTTVRIGIVAVNLVIWTGLFVYLLRLSRKVRQIEEAAPEVEHED